jgi:hypothetical protein
MSPLALQRLLGRCLTEPHAQVNLLADPDFAWERLIDAANRAYLTPALYAALYDAGVLARLPHDVVQYLATLAERNALRNTRLRAQSLELVEALNRSGIVPTLLKGAAGLFAERPDRYAASRMVTDLDLLISADEVERALAALGALGYRRLEGRAIGRHAVGDFIRDKDVGAVDLHLHLLNEPRLMPAHEAVARGEERTVGGVRARVLSPTDRMLHLLLHDLVQDHGIHDGSLNYRHLHEIATVMAVAPARWDFVATHLGRYRLGHLLDFAVLAAHEFLSRPIPPVLKPSLAARLHLARAMLQMRYPALTRCGEIIGNLHRSLAWYRHADHHRRLPRLRRAVDYLRVHRTRTAKRILHVVFAHRT